MLPVLEEYNYQAFAVQWLNKRMAINLASRCIVVTQKFLWTLKAVLQYVDLGTHSYSAVYVPMQI